MSSIETEIELEGMLFMSSTSGGEVNDVKVDGVSVVSNGIANIDLSNKQDKLTAGDNITIDENGVISATGGGGGTVDQNFDPTSTNAQSGVAVHQAVSPAIGYANAALSMLGEVPEDTDVQTEINDLDIRVTYLEEHGGGGGNNYVTPQQFGAKGDGTTNDTDAIQSALNYAFSNKMSVYFKGGTYKITNKLIIPDETKIFGDGRKSIIKSTINDGYVLQGTNVNGDTSIRHCSFDSICFENGNIADVDTHLIQGDFVGKIYGGYFNNCTISKYYNVFDHISNCTYLINCRFTTIYNCFMNTSVDSVIDGCYINASTYSSAYGSKAFGNSFNSTSLTNSIIDYFCDVFAISSINSGTIEGNTFNRCETIFHDTFQRLAVSNNIFSIVDYVIKFDNLVQSATNHIMSNIVFSNNVGIDVDYYFYVANGVNVIPAKCEFRGNRISVSSNGTMSNVDVGFRSTSTTETTYNSMKDVYFDFWDLKTFENGLPSADLRGDTAKSVVSFPFMRAIYEDKLFTNIDGRWFSKENTSNKITTISDLSTNEQYPSAKAVYDLFNSIVNGNEVAY